MDTLRSSITIESEHIFNENKLIKLQLFRDSHLVK